MVNRSVTPAQLLQAAVSGGPVARPLLAPLASAVAGELQGLTPREVLRDVTKFSNLLRDLYRSLQADVSVVEFGTLWDAEVLGIPLDWGAGFPPTPGQAAAHITPGVTPEFHRGQRSAVVVEALHRLRLVLGEEAVLAAGVTGPVTLADLSGGTLTPAAAAPLVLAAVRTLCDAGARLIWVVEQADADAPADPAALAAAMGPVWGTIRFYKGLGVLHIAGAADGWLPLLTAGGPYLPVFDPQAAPNLAALARDGRGLFGLALPPGPPLPVARTLVRTGRCALLTHDGELAGRVQARHLRQAVSDLRSAGIG